MGGKSDDTDRRWEESGSDGTENATGRRELIERTHSNPRSFMCFGGSKLGLGAFSGGTLHIGVKLRNDATELEEPINRLAK